MGSLAKSGNVETSFLIKLITVLTVGIVLFVLIKNTSQSGANIVEKSACKESVEQYAKLRIPGTKLTDTNVIKCPVQIKPPINPSDDERAKKTLAGWMVDCFDQFGAGELDIFETRRGSTDHYCVVCSKVTFTDNDKKIEGFAQYLSDEFVPGKKMTYFQYFKGDTVEEGEAQTVNKCVETPDGLKCEPTPDALENAPFDIIDTSTEHAILFSYSKSTGWWDNIVAGGVGGTVGIVVGGAVAGFFTGGFGWVAAGTAFVGGAAGGGFGFVKAPSLESQSDWQAGVIMLPYNQNVQEYLDCDEVPIKQ